MSVTVLRVVKRPNDFIRRMIVRMPVVMSDLGESIPRQEELETNSD